MTTVRKEKSELRSWFDRFSRSAARVCLLSLFEWEATGRGFGAPWGRMQLFLVLAVLYRVLSFSEGLAPVWQFPREKTSRAEQELGATGQNGHTRLYF